MRCQVREAASEGACSAESPLPSSRGAQHAHRVCGQCPFDRAWHQDLRPSGLHAIGNREAVLGCRIRRDEHGLATERRLSNQIRFGGHCHASVSAKSGAYADMRTTSAFRSRPVRNAASANAACQTLRLSPLPTGVVCAAYSPTKILEPVGG